ncbi:hypothetical protein Axi01nite_51990 [Actinoplanes xinjiangensis]|nr:hypothetical protein Axi01nite_51990 [Actinoplanes xinjiangensis]
MVAGDRARDRRREFVGDVDRDAGAVDFGTRLGPLIGDRLHGGHDLWSGGYREFHGPGATRGGELLIAEVRPRNYDDYRHRTSDDARSL